MRSLWHTGVADGAPYPPLLGDLVVDVVVIGGGITGLVTALQLAEAGQRVAVLEAHRFGQSNTGNSTGNLYGTISQGISKIRKKWDDETVRQVVAARSQAVDLIERSVQLLSIDCQFSRCPLHFIAREPNGPLDKMLQEEYEASAVAGLSVKLVDRVAELPFAVHKAVRVENQAQFNPLRFAQGLAKAVAGMGVSLFENSRAIEVDAGQGTVVTDSGKIMARNIVYATHTPLGVNLLQAEMEPYREYGISARLRGDQYPHGIYWIKDDSQSLRSYEYGGVRYLTVVGGHHKTGHSDPNKNYIRELQDYAQARFDVEGFEHQWSAQQFISADLLPYIGRSGHDNVFVGTGYAADGLTWGTVAGMVISDLILGRENRFADLFNPRRFTPVKSAKTWASENVSVARHLIQDYLTPAKLTHLEEVLPGEGKLVNLDGEKLAVYRSPDNQLSVLSPVCPHMKCMVSWNSTETTWDCPCHGSRFSPQGDVLEGPALSPLAPHGPSPGAKA